MMPHPETMTREAFAARPLDARSYYQYLPSDALAMGAEITWEAFLHAVRTIERTTTITQEVDALDTALFYLLSHGRDIAPEQYPVLQALAHKAVYDYSGLLKGAKSSREIRMRLAYLCYCICDVLDANMDVSSAQQSALPYLSPWDYLPEDGAQWFITSETENVICCRDAMVTRYTCGLPSQMDVLTQGQICVGSIFSNGAWFIAHGEPRHIEHHLPLVLCWQHEDTQYGIDYRGGIYRIEDGRTQADVLTNIAVEEVSKCRRFADALYLFDWTAPQIMTIVSLRDFSVRTQPLPELFLGNDILVWNDEFLLIDKLQGRVFAYDRNFVLQRTYLAFGKGQGRLYDPISLRAHNGQVHVTNWLTSTLVRFTP